MLEKYMPKKQTGEISMIPAKTSRLYSKFPAGSVGLALLLLRLIDGLGLAREGTRLVLPAMSSSEPVSVPLLGLALVASAVMLILGLRTTFAGSAAAICTVAAALHGKPGFASLGSEMYAGPFLLALVFFLSASFSLLGPGGYSLDARLSGWRMIRLSSGQSSSNAPKEGSYVDR
jgi:uncharacterized membrane protein YphA (DoxX/SURF4 family)